MPPEPNWKDSLPKEIRSHKTLADVADVGSLAKQFIDAQAVMGTSIRIPGPDAGAEALSAFHLKLAEKVPGLIPTPNPDSEEQMSALFDRMGRPKEAIGYEHPDGVDPTQMTDFAVLAHGLGLTKTQYKGMLSELVKHTTTKQESTDAEFQAASRALKQEWGIVYEDNLQLVQSVMKGTGAPKEFMELAADSKLPAATLKWLHAIGKQLGTEGINFQKDESTTRLSPTEAKARSDEIMADTKGPYWDGSHPQHKEYVQRVVDLNRAAAAGGKL
ncbi:hypothetical protein LCGC14_1043660 [marine sediment metagenome]|uniref:Uncharacterized protein n=1 Tax=marine sediment metagenome TaxID=412755 RepID=A0A0F9MVE5_9ZZZZ